MSNPSLLSEQICADRARARQAGRGEEGSHGRRNSQATPPSSSSLQRGATTPVGRDGPPLQSPTYDSRAIQTLRRASTAPEQSRYASEFKARTMTRNMDHLTIFRAQTADLDRAMVSGG